MIVPNESKDTSGGESVEIQEADRGGEKINEEDGEEKRYMIGWRRERIHVRIGKRKGTCEDGEEKECIGKDGGGKGYM